MGAKRLLKFSVPVIDQNAIDEVVDCLKSGWLVSGPRVLKFEKNLAKFFQARYVLALNSATNGLFLTLKALGIQAGDEIITTPMTFIATLNVIAQIGARPVLVDIDLNTRNIDVHQIEAAITSRTKAILPVHFAGIPVDLKPLYEIAQRYRLRVIEDAAHAIGSEYRNQKIGSFGDTQVFSFHANKIITTGEGGAVLTRDEQLADQIKTLRYHGIDYNSPYCDESNRYFPHYDVTVPGYKCTMMDLQAAIGIHQLTRLTEFIQKRAQLVQRYQQLLADCPGLMLPEIPKYPCKIAWYLYAPLVTEKAKVSRDHFIYLMRQQQIDLKCHYRAAHLYRFYQRQFRYQPGQFPVAERVSQTIVSLPLFSTMTEADQDRVVETIKKIL